MFRRIWSGIRRVRWWQWLTLFAVVAIAVRVVLPPILRSVMASQASQLLNAQVEIGDVDLALLSGGVALMDVAVREKWEIATEAGAEAQAEADKGAEAPAQADGAAGTTPAPNTPPLIGWKRFAIELDWLPLFSKTVRLKTIELDAPYVGVDRLESGEINLAALVPKSEPEAETPEEESEPGTPWGFGVDRLALSAGKLRFRDLMMRDADPIDISLDAIEVKEVAIRPEMYGEPANVHLVVKVDEGTLSVDARLSVLEEGVAVDADIKADHLPVHRSRSYIPIAGWNRLDGFLGMDLKYRLETEKHNEISGAIALDGVTARSDTLEQPVLAWKRFDVTLDSIDLIAQNAKVAAVWIEGLSLPVRAKGDDHLPAIATKPTAKDEAQPTPEATAAPASPAPAAEDGKPVEEKKPWTWSVGKIELTDAHVTVIDAEPPLDAAIQIKLSDLRDKQEQPSPLQLSVGAANGTLALDGALMATPPGFDGTLKIDHIDVPTLLAAAGVPPAQSLKSATFETDLRLAVGSSAPTPGDVQVGGTLALRQARIVGDNEKEFAAAVEAIEIALAQLRLPGLLTPSSDAAATAPITVDVSSLRITKPTAQLTNTEQGLVLPRFASAEAQPAEPVPAPTPAATPTTAGAAPGVAVTVGSLQINGGKIGFNDRTVNPHYAGTIAGLTVDVRDARWPEQAVQKFSLKLTTPPQGALDVRGTLVKGKGNVEVDAKEIGLLPFNPYSTKYSPYAITNGALTLKTKVKIDGKKYGVSNAIKLLSFDMGSQDDAAFQQQFGVPLSLALSLLRDLEGHISLDVPVDIDEKGTSVGIGTIVAGALRSALVGALASPLKMFGAVVQGGKVQGVAPPTIAFRLGRDEPVAGGDAQLKQLGVFLAGRPTMGLALSTAPSSLDARWLKEQALRGEMEEPQGFLGTLRNLGQRDERRQISDALAARARDEKGELAGEAAQALETMLAERPDPPAEQLRTLAESRMTRIQTALREQPGVSAARITRDEVAGEISKDQPIVRLTMAPIE